MSPIPLAPNINRSLHNDEETLGWTTTPNVRGTLDIIWSCAITLFLCTWTALTINVPPLGGNQYTNFQRKFLVFLETIAGPEFILHTAMGQWNSARKSVAEFKELGYEGWTMRHGFFADMGGFILNTDHYCEHDAICTSEREFPPFPLNVGQILYLVRNNYILYKDVLIDLEEIEDKNKFDGVSRLIMVCQLGWFSINIIARGCQNLAITTMELTTAGFIFCTFFMCWFWRNKPQDVLRGKEIRLQPQKNTETNTLEPGTLKRILIEAGEIAQLPYEYTPLDFATRTPHWFGTCFSWGEGHLLPTIAFGLRLHPRKRPINKIWDDRFEELGVWDNVFLATLGCVFAAIHLAAWDFHFPTDIERMLWRVCSAYILCSIFAAIFVLLWMFLALPSLKERWINVGKVDIRDLAFRFHVIKALLKPDAVADSNEKNISKQKFRTIETPPPTKVFAAMLLSMGCLYVACRGVILVEDVINLRSLPSSAYKTVEWSNFVPHFH